MTRKTISEATKVTGTRIYRVDIIGPAHLKGDPAPATIIETRLVRAQNPAQALHHVCKNRLNARIATQDDMVACLSRGLKIEVATTVGAKDPEPVPAPSAPLTGGYIDPKEALESQSKYAEERGKGTPEDAQLASEEHDRRMRQLNDDLRYASQG